MVIAHLLSVNIHRNIFAQFLSLLTTLYLLFFILKNIFFFTYLKRVSRGRTENANCVIRKLICIVDEEKNVFEPELPA
jgi:hypothetical protein